MFFFNSFLLVELANSYIIMTNIMDALLLNFFQCRIKLAYMLLYCVLCILYMLLNYVVI